MTMTETSILKPATHKEKIAYRLLTQGGFTEREGVIELNITSGRNYINEMEKHIGIKLHRENESNITNNGFHFRYLASDKVQAQAVINFINSKRLARNAEPISESEANAILARFKG